VRIVFIGTVEFSKKILEKLMSLKSDIAAVLTRKTSDFNSDFCDLSPLCKVHGIPFRYIDDINSEDTVEYIRKLKPEIIFCFGFSQMLSEDILNIPPMGVLGYHPAKLPKNRGRHPIIWALTLGYTKTSSTFLFLDKGVDNGDILNEKDVDISYEDDARSLYDKITATALGQIEDFLPKLEKNKFEKHPQDQSKACYLRERGKQDGRINFNQNSRQIYNLVRALARPYIGAHIDYNGNEIKVWQAQETMFPCKETMPGTIIDIKAKKVFVKCADNIIVLKKHGFKKLPKVGEVLV